MSSYTPRTVFLLGAGFSNAVSPDTAKIPVTKDLGISIRDEYNRDLSLTDSEQADLVHDFEETLTRMASAKPWLTHSENLQERVKFLDITDRIRVLFQQVVSRAVDHFRGEPPPFFTKVLSFWHYNQSRIITLNYDTLIEWTTSHFYTSDKKNLNLRTGDLYPPGLFPLRRQFRASDPSGPGETFQLYKLHGSINWLYSGKEDFSNEILYYQEYCGGLDGPWTASYGASERRDWWDRAEKRPLIIPPAKEKSTFLRHDALKSVWFLAARALKQAAKVVCIGYSFPKSDLTMVQFIKDACANRKISFEIVDKEGMISHFKDVLGDQAFEFSQHFSGEDAVASFCSNLI